MAIGKQFEGYEAVDFPPHARSLPETSDDYVYAFCWILDGVESPFYVGQTKRLAGRMNDYRMAQFAACTDFRVGEAVKYLRDSKKCRIIVRYKVSAEMRKDEHALIRELHLSGVGLLNDLSGYNYRTANQTQEKAAVHKFCEVMLDKREYRQPSEIGDLALKRKRVEDRVANKRTVSKEREMSNHDMFAEAFKEYANQVLKTEDIGRILLRHYPEFNTGSILPNDHAGGDKGACECARKDWRIFDKVKRGLYRVRPSSPR